MRITRRFGIITGIAALALTGAGMAGAAIAGGPVDSSGVIHGCYTAKAVNGSHVFVLQDAATSCPTGTTAITWNQQGPEGPAGPQGAAGPQGPVGVSGYQIESCELTANQPQANPLCHDTSQSGGHESGTLYCPTGKVAISAAYDVSSQGTQFVPDLMAPVSDQNGSGYRFGEEGNGGFIFVYVTCANTS